MSSSFFPPGSGSSNAPWLQDVQVFCDNAGNNGNSGNNPSAPKKTAYAAAEALVALGGGTLNIADGCEIGGPVTGQGLWFRGDGFTVPGFLQSVPMVVKGWGKSEGQGPFQSPVACRISGGGGRKTPPIWIVATNQPTRVEYYTQENAHQTGARLGADYLRNVDGSTLEVDVSSATRTGTTTVYTVTLPAAITIASATRLSNVTTLTITNPGMAYIPFRLGSIVRVTSTSGSFPSGDYTLLSSGNPIADNTTWTISYADTGSNTTVANIGTVKSHGCNPGDYIDLTSTNVNFFSTQYRVVSATVDTITVTDVFGAGNSTQSNIGTLCRQERFLAYTSSAQLFRCGFGIDETDTGAGPSVDIGHTQGIGPVLEECWVTGYVGTDGLGPRDEDRMAAVFVNAGDAGSIGPPAADITMLRCNGSNGTIQVNAGSTSVSHVHIDGLLMEANFTALALPVLRVNGGSTAISCFGRDLNNADNAPTAPTVILNGVDIAGTDFKRCGVITGKAFGGDLWTNPGYWQSNSIPSPWSKQQVTGWADGRISGKHPATARAGAVYSARYQNKLLLPGSWTGGHLTKTAGQADPFGGTAAYKLVNSDVDFIAMKALAADGNTWQVGGKLVISGWINSKTATDFINDSLIAIVSGGAITFAEGPNQPVPFGGNGWQFVQTVYNVTAVTSTTPSYYPALYLATNCDVDVWGWTGVYVPASVNDNDAMEYAGTLIQQPVYLAPGMTGTMEGVPLIGHGGLGVSAALAKTAGVGSGQLTLTGTGTTYIPIYAADGTTIQGWVAQLQATVNP